MYNILLAGANGFIGTFLYNNLKKDYFIHALGSSKGLIKENFSQLDLTKNEEVENFVKGAPKFDVLIFLVGLAHKKGKNKDLEQFRLLNKQTLVNLLTNLDKRNKLPGKIIFSSTISVYGEKNDQTIYYECSEKTPSSPYAITKLDSEEYLVNNYGSQSWILRFAPVYYPDFQLNINRRTKANGISYKVGDGSKKLSLCNLENIGLVVKGILENKVPSGVYNISDSKDYSYNDLLAYVDTKWIVRVPNSLIKGLYYIGKMMNNLFLIENTIKLISDNIFSSNKINQYIKLPSKLNKHEEC